MGGASAVLIVEVITALIQLLASHKKASDISDEEIHEKIKEAAARHKKLDSDHLPDV